MKFNFKCLIILLLFSSTLLAQTSDSLKNSTSDSTLTVTPIISDSTEVNTPASTSTVESTTPESTPVIENKASESTSTVDYSNSTTEYTYTPTKSFINPKIGLGIGTFTFFGDLYQKKLQPPSIGKIAYDLSISQTFDFLQFSFYTLSGKVSVNERTYGNARNLNFQSKINVAGGNIAYNFSHFLPKNKTVFPYISLGLETVEFLSKTDLKDSKGNFYNYWTDGTIRNMPQSDINAANAIVIQRDYTYETDIRELNLDGFGKYAERTWALPIGIGVVYSLSENWSCRLSSTMHFTFTDYIDGVTDKSIGIRAGNKNNDKFLMSSFSISYNFGSGGNEGFIDDDPNYLGVDFLALDNEDYDQDGVSDLKDSCAGTPPGYIVDEKGCPYDDDEDGVPNDADDEKNSRRGAIVTLRGVTITDSILAYNYKQFNDTIGGENEIIYVNKDKNSAAKGHYTVQLGSFSKKMDPALMTKILSINDLTSTEMGDSTIYSAGTYGVQSVAESRKNALINDGFPDAKVVFKQNNKIKAPPKIYEGTIMASDSAKANSEIVTLSVNEALNKGVVLRVQLGAYKNKLSKDVFKGINDLIEIETSDGLYKYMTGAFKTFEEASKHRADMVLKGYKGAFITAYKGGGRVTLIETGATPSEKGGTVKETPDNIPVNGIDRKLLVFKVQIGIFKDEPPEHKLELFTRIPDVKGEKTPSGITIYTAGRVNTYKEAEALKKTLISKYKLEDAFIISYFNGTFIPIEEALELEK